MDIWLLVGCAQPEFDGSLGCTGDTDEFPAWGAAPAALCDQDPLGRAAAHTLPTPLRRRWLHCLTWKYLKYL